MRVYIVSNIIAVLSLAIPTTPPAHSAEQPRKPNILLIVADDLGYAELGCQGCKDVPTPHIDSLAKNGVRCTNGYVSCPVCSPTRAGLLTGRYQQRFGHEFNPGPINQAEKNFGLPLTEKTLADRLKAAGYATGLVGKWHLGFAERFRPMQRGFDEFFGFLGGAHSYVDARADGANPILRGDEEVNEKEYLTDALGREAVAFINKHADGPFFLCLTFNAVHAPLQGAATYRSRFAGIDDPRRRTFAAMLSALDDNVGKVLNALRAKSLEKDTLIFFLSDNGGPTQQTTSRNDPLRGFKTQTFEGGIRVPFLVKWPGRAPAGKVYDQPIISLDITPTALAAAGVKPPQDAAFDGVDLLPFLAGDKKEPPHRALYWRFGSQWAVRMGNMKLVKAGDGPPQLFDLDADVGEKKDLADTMPETVEKLRSAHTAWDKQLAKPLWGRGRQ